MPDSNSKCGEPIAPALNMTSLLASTISISPEAVRYSTPVAVSLPASEFEDNTRGLSARYDREVRPPLWLAFQEGLIRARPLALPCGALHERYRTGGSTPVSPIVVAAWDASGNRCLYEITSCLKHW